MSRHGAHGARETAGTGKVRAINAIFTVLLVALFLFGAAVALYPAYSNLYNEYRNARIAAEYEDAASALSAEEAARLLAEAQAYNAEHTVNVIYDPFADIVAADASADGASDAASGGEPGSAAQAGAADAADAANEADAADAADAADGGSRLSAQAPDVNAVAEAFGLVDEKRYMSLLNIAGDGVMGFIDIPVIGVRLAMYHGTSPDVLDHGVGHMRGTSLPVGGDGSHCVLSAHRGLPAAKLFTDLDQVVTGDRFYLHVLNEVFAYEVDDIRVVKPEETSTLGIEPGRDLATLVTCTPYGVNTHRMLVRGHRVPYDPPEVTESAASWLAAFTAETLALVAVMSLLVLVAFVVFIRRVVGKGSKKTEPGDSGQGE